MTFTAPILPAPHTVAAARVGAPVQRRTRRILITGSRRWPWPIQIALALDDQRARLATDGVLIVMHGACPDGADAAAATWCREATQTTGVRVIEEPHPARWRDDTGRFHRNAGMIRNADMIAAGADLVIGFWLDRSPGTGNTLRHAAHERIPAVVYTAYTPKPAHQPRAGDGGQRRSTNIRPSFASSEPRLSRNADAEAEAAMNQGYDPIRNPVCTRCHTQKSIMGVCLCD
jgi:YspA, cpYpsA-related SLOG family